MQREELLNAMRLTATNRKTTELSFADFKADTGTTQHTIHKHFDRWSQACEAAGINAAPSGTVNLKKGWKQPTSEAECIAEIQRIAVMLGKGSITLGDFKKHAKFTTTVLRLRFGKQFWDKALRKAGLERGGEWQKPIDLDALAQDFLRVTRELSRIPTLTELSRRSQYAKNTFCNRHGGYRGFKKVAIQHLKQTAPVPDIVNIFNAELLKLDDGEPSPDHAEAPSFAYGKSLGFRGFVHVPTYEQEVVSVFSTVAHELGFEILCNRPSFPDCEARRKIPGARKRYVHCRIEFELRSGDFKAHGHSPNGCDLIVCWEHNWSACPVEVLELRTAIRKLEGWH